MLYNQPTGGAANDPYVGKNVAAGIQGSKVPPGAIEFPQREIMAVINDAIAEGLAIAASNGDLTQLLKSIKYLIPRYAPAAVGPASNGGLAKDGSGNLLLSLIANLLGDARATPVDNDVFALGRAADGAMVSVSAAKFGAYVKNLFQTNNSFARISAANSIGMSLQNTGDFTVPRGVLTQVPLQAVGGSAIGSVSNGVLTIAIGGYYVITIGGAIFLSSSGHASDAATFRFQLANSGTGISGPLYGTSVIPPNGGQGAANFLNSIVTKVDAGAQIALSAFADNLFHDGTNCGVSGYTNMNVALLNT